MKLFVDTANINEIKDAASWGIIDGVTTNPSLLAKEGKNPDEALKEIFAIIAGHISVEVINIHSKETIIEEARALAKKWGKTAAIKIPMTKEAIKATAVLSKEGLRVNMTLIFSPAQAILAAKAGAAYVSPFVGRLDDLGQEGMKYIAQMAQIFHNYDFSTEIIVASVRHPIHVIQAAELGAHIATVPYKILDQMFKHSLTDIGIDRFNKDWAGIKK